MVTILHQWESECKRTGLANEKKMKCKNKKLLIMKLFALKSSHDFGKLVAGHLGISLGELEEREFEDGEMP